MKACEESLTRLGTDHIDLYQVHRPEPGVDIEETLGALDDLVHQGCATWQLDLPAQRHRRGPVGGRAAQHAAVRVRAAALLAARAGRRGRGPAHVRALRHGRHRLEPAGGRVAVGPVAARRRERPAGAERIPGRYDLSDPANQAKLVAADGLAKLAEDRDMTLVHVALAFVMNHPAVTAAIIGHAPPSTSTASSVPPTWCSTTSCSTRSTSWSRPAPTSHRSARATFHRPSPGRGCAAGPGTEQATRGAGHGSVGEGRHRHRIVERHR